MLILRLSIISFLPSLEVVSQLPLQLLPDIFHLPLPLCGLAPTPSLHILLASAHIPFPPDSPPRDLPLAPEVTPSASPLS